MMRRISKLGVVALLIGTTGLFGCRKDDPDVKDKLDKILANQAAEDKKLDTIAQGRGAAAGAPGARPPMNEPDPKLTYSVPIDGDYPNGPATAKVTIVEAADYACPFCARVGGTVDELKKQYGDQVRVVYKHFVVHPQIAMTPALAACAAGEQGKFWEFHHAIWDGAWEVQPQPHMKDPKMLGADQMEVIAKGLNLDMKKFKDDMAGDKCKNDINGTMAFLSKMGVHGTPAFFINGRYVSGAQPIDNFKTIIDEEIKKADTAIAAGTKAEDYYKTAIVDKGKKSL